MRMPWAPQFGQKDATLLEEVSLLSSYLEVKRMKFQYALFQGGVSKPVLREVILKPEAVAVLLIDPDKEQVILVEQFRTGALFHVDGPWLLELVAGVCDKNEDPKETVIREVKEETGCDVLSIVPICAYLTTPGISAEKIHVFYARIKAPIHNHEIHGMAEEGENIKVWALSFDEALQLLAEGKIVSSPTVIGLQWLQINRASLYFPE